MDPFEEKEEGTSIASDVVKVKGEDLATPGEVKSAFIIAQKEIM